MSSQSVLEFISDPHDGFKELCRLKKQWGLLLSFPGPQEGREEDYRPSIQAMVPWLDVKADYFFPALWSDTLWVFGPAEEIEKLYSQVHGDDGPCTADGSCSPHHVYALTCDSLGRFMNENT